jgi:hypothetical protein
VLGPCRGRRRRSRRRRRRKEEEERGGGKKRITWYVQKWAQQTVRDMLRVHLITCIRRQRA